MFIFRLDTSSYSAHEQSLGFNYGHLLGAYQGRFFSATIHAWSNSVI